ncbi:hypothetical protein BC831DRAFT_513071 [Entophlyctis helioformis]|nr:hypothetical protein BC831DRAFT_513071 [Entophlyctis helioformis]
MRRPGGCGIFIGNAPFLSAIVLSAIVGPPLFSQPSSGRRSCPSELSALWLLASRLEEDAGLPVKARATLERARLLNPNAPELWCEAVRVEMRSNNQPMAKALLAKALQACPTSGQLWSQMIATEARPQRRARSVDALQKCENDPVVVTTVAQLFWAERKLDKARSWFNRAIKTNRDLDDTCGMQHGILGSAMHDTMWLKVP